MKKILLAVSLFCLFIVVGTPLLQATTPLPPSFQVQLSADRVGKPSPDHPELQEISVAKGEKVSFHFTVTPENTAGLSWEWSFFSTSLQCNRASDAKLQELDCVSLVSGTSPVSVVVSKNGQETYESNAVYVTVAKEGTSTPPKPEVCTEEYVPVCGKVAVVCIAAPCNPVSETFPNRCAAERAGVLEIQEGACISEIQKISFEDPIATQSSTLLPFSPALNPFKKGITGTDSIAARAVFELWRRKAVNGNESGDFFGARKINRAEALKIALLIRYSVEEINNAESSRQINAAESWYQPFILFAEQKGIINSAQNFRAADNVTMAEFLKMMVLTFGLEKNLKPFFQDVSANAWYAPYAGVAKVYDLAFDSAALFPERTLTREVAAVMIYQYLKNREKILTN